MAFHGSVRAGVDGGLGTYRGVEHRFRTEESTGSHARKHRAPASTDGAATAAWETAVQGPGPYPARDWPWRARFGVPPPSWRRRRSLDGCRLRRETAPSPLPKRSRSQGLWRVQWHLASGLQYHALSSQRDQVRARPSVLEIPGVAQGSSPAGYRFLHTSRHGRPDIKRAER